MAELDYAFLADFAKVDATGTLTSVGASFTVVTAATLPSSHQLAIAGRIRAKINEGPIPIRIEVQGPATSYSIAVEGQLEAGPSPRPYGDDNVGHLFALNLTVPLPAVGLYTVHVEIAGKRVRMLAFDVVTPELS